MFTVPGMRKLHSWTHESLTAVLDHLSTLPESDYAQEVPGFGFPTLREQVVHVFNCEAFWIHILQGAGFRDQSSANWLDVARAKALQGRVSAETLRYLTGLTDERLNTDTELRFSDGDVAVRTPAFVIHHVVTHAYHHKGQMVAMCRVLGHPAPDTDLNQFEE